MRDQNKTSRRLWPKHWSVLAAVGLAFIVAACDCPPLFHVEAKKTTLNLPDAQSVIRLADRGVIAFRGGEGRRQIALQIDDGTPSTLVFVDEDLMTFCEQMPWEPARLHFDDVTISALAEDGRSEPFDRISLHWVGRRRLSLRGERGGTPVLDVTVSSWQELGAYMENSAWDLPELAR